MPPSPLVPRAAHYPDPVVLSDLPLRADLRDLTPYGAPQLDVAVRLNTNENAHDVPPHVADAIVEAVREVVTTLNRYPDREATALRAALAAYTTRQSGVAVGVDQVWPANGSNEVLQHLLLAFGGPGRRALGFVPTYSMHQIIATVTATTWISGRRGPGFDLSAPDAVDQVREHAPDLVFVCSPNNPTGTALDADVVAAIVDAAPGAVVVVDEAYAEFARPGTRSAISSLAGQPRLVVTRTMSKAFAFAGARLGYLVAGTGVVDAMRLVRLPYHLSTLTQAAAVAALDHADELQAGVGEIIAQRDRIVVGTRERGFQPVPSDANFVLVGGFADAGTAWRSLLDAGVLVRDVGLAGHLRVTAGTVAETTAFLEALDAIAPATSPIHADQAPIHADQAPSTPTRPRS